MQTTREPRSVLRAVSSAAAVGALVAGLALTGAGGPAGASAAPTKTAPKKTVPSKTTPKKTVPTKTVPKKTLPAKTVPATTPPPPQCIPSSSTQPLRGVTQAKSGYLPLLKPAQAWPIARGTRVAVALLDTGVNAAAGRSGGVLAGRLVDGGNFASDTDKLGGLLDCDGQGTGDAGLIAATDAGSGLPGMAPEAKVISVRVQLEADIAPKPAVVARGIAAAVTQGAKVIVVASPCAPSTALAAAIKQAVRADVLVIAAVGDPQTATTTSYPAMYPGVIGVASSGSNGTAAATGTFVDLSAPGSELVVLSVLSRGYVSAQGTARAAALTAGTAALVRSAYPRLKVPAVTTRLEYSADHPSGAVPNKTAGWGVVDPYAALTLPADRTAPPTPAPASHLAPVVLPPPDDPDHRYLGATVAAVLLSAALAATAALSGVRRARRRRWQVARHD